MIEYVTYGEGGYDPDKPDNNVIERIEHPDSPPPDLPADVRLAALEATNSELLAALAKATSLAQIRAAVAELA